MERDKLQTAVQLAQVMATKFGSPGYEHMRLQVSGKCKYSDYQVFSALAASRQLKNRAALRSMMSHFLRYQFGETSALPLNVVKAPSSTQLSRYLFCADMALLLYRLRQGRGEEYARFGWSDSSPLLSADWCMNMCVAIRKSQAIRVWKAACLLDRASDSMAEEDGRAVQDAHDTILSEIQTQVLLPTNVEMGHVDVTHKTAALCFAIAMETPSRIWAQSWA